jgi:uncharacterized protein (TIGR03435 family)
VRHALPIVAALVLGAASAIAQDDLPAFEVASVKPVTGDPVFGGPDGPDRFVREDVRLLDLIAYAYDVPLFRVAGGPEWLRSSRFAIEARADGVPSADEMRLMVRRLLFERFRLRVHTETREMDRFTLVTARRDGRLGDRMRPSAIDCPAIIAARGLGYRSPNRPPQAGDPPLCAARYRVAGGNLTLMLEGESIAQLTTFLERQVGRTVVDHTGLSGTYDLELEFTPDSRLGVNGVAAPSAAPGEETALFTALREQLGLNLESDRGPVERVVIDAAALPTAN